MRFSKMLLAGAAGFAAIAASAQDSPAPAGDPETMAEADPAPGLADLETTVNQLLDEETNPPAGGEAVADTEPAAGEEADTGTEAGDEPDAAAQAESGAEPAAVAETEPEPAVEQAPAEAPAARVERASATTPATTETPQPAPPLTRQQIAALDRTVERGRLLVAIARAGIVATQDMLTRVSDPNGAGITGWIAEPAGNSMVVTFYADAAEGAAGDAAVPKAVYSATVLGGRVTSREIHLGADRPSLTPLQARMAAARAASENDELRACTDQPFNVFVVPPASPTAPVDVYRISAPAERGRFPLGGHFRATVAANGSVESRSFANACVALDAPAVPDGQQPRPIGVTHLLDPMPTEVHLLLAQMVGRPLLVITGEPQRIWLVTGDRVAEVRDTAQR